MANRDANSVSVIADGAVTGTVSVGSVPAAIGINDLTNRVYVVNLNSSTITVIDGSIKTTTTVTPGAQPNTVAIDKIRNKIYIANGNGLCLTVIDGKTNAATTVGEIGNGSADLAVNVLTNQVFQMTPNPSGSAVSVFSGSRGLFSQGLLDRIILSTNGVREQENRHPSPPCHPDQSSRRTYLFPKLSGTNSLPPAKTI